MNPRATEFSEAALAAAQVVKRGGSLYPPRHQPVWVAGLPTRHPFYLYFAAVRENRRAA